MKEFSYTITDPVGIHARPAGLLAKAAKAYQSTVTLYKGEKSANVTRLMAVMGLGVKCGDTVKVTAEGADEDTAIAEMETFFKENL
ncbi:MAG TPA: HPr family phosphocarrier protein [Candidatus Egerieicola faecale]|jgi:phosphocarrier,  HPr family|uniref:HPr family phosphocarrier protein n=1 Tax=Candidatus Egerieicola faecale TaxID=2840774 RepID=A0A9D1IUW9_9FIRM|nr:HPr family phosphocarrier protein [Candidatus Egerieicola faecale]